MKRVLGLILALVIVSSIALAAKVETFDSLSNITGTIEYNVLEYNTTLKIRQYRPAHIIHTARSETTEGSSKDLYDVIKIGALSNTTLEGRNLHSALPSFLKPCIRGVYQAIDEDVSQ